MFAQPETFFNDCLSFFTKFRVNARWIACLTAPLPSALSGGYTGPQKAFKDLWLPNAWELQPLTNNLEREALFLNFSTTKGTTWHQITTTKKYIFNLVDLILALKNESVTALK